MRKYRFLSVVFLLLAIILVAGCTDKKIKVTFDLNGGNVAGNTEQVVVEVPKGKVIPVEMLPRVEKTDFVFKGWLKDEVVFDVATEAITEAITLKAKWEAAEKPVPPVEKVKVTFDTDGGNAIESVEIEKGSKVTAPKAPTKEGHTFLEWQLNGVTFDFNEAVNEDITLKAVYQLKEYQVKFIVEGVELATKTVKYGELVTKPTDEPTKDGHRFLGWDLNGVLYEFTTPVRSNLELTAHFQPLNQHTVTVPSEVTAVDPTIDLLNVLAGTEVEFLVTPPANKQIKEVLVNGEITAVNPENKFKVIINDATTITVEFEWDQALIDDVQAELDAIPATIDVLIREYEVISIEKIKEQIVYNTDIIKLDIVKENDVYTLKATSVIEPQIELTKVVTVNEVFIYQLTLAAEIAVVEPVGLNVNAVRQDTVVTVEVNLPQYYVIDQLLVDGLAVVVENNRATITVTKDLKITATFKADPAIQTEVELELEKVSSELIFEDNITAAKVEEAVKLLVDNDLVTVLATVDGNVADVTLTSTKITTVKATKQVNVKIATVSVTVDYNDPAASTPQVIVINKNTGITRDLLTEAPNVAGKVIKEFRIGAVDGAPYQFGEAISEDMTLYAVWFEGYEVLFDLDGGEGEFAPLYLEAGATLEAPTTKPTKPGYRFVSWTHNDSDYTFGEVLTESITLKAKWDLYLAYHVENDYVVIDGFLKNKLVTEVVLPETLEGYPVKKLAARSFYNDDIEKFVANKGLESIGSYAFMGRTSLVSVTLSETIKEIGAYAFYKTNITEIVLPNSVETIGHMAFSNTFELTNVIFVNPDFIQINESQFRGSKWIEDLRVVNQATNMTVVNNVLIEFNGANTEFVIPSGVIRIGDRAAYDKRIETITFNEELKYIGKEAFVYNRMEELNLPSSLVEIAPYAFSSIYTLTTVTFAQNGPNMAKIGIFAFANNGKLTSFEWPQTVTVLEQAVFDGAALLEAITNDTAILEVKRHALSGTAFLQNQIADNKYAHINNILIRVQDNFAVFEVPEHITSIAEGAFVGERGPGMLTINQNVLKIYKDAIHYLSPLTTLNINGYIPTIEDGAITIIGPKKVTVIVSDIDEKAPGWGQKWLNALPSYFAEVIWSPVCTVEFDFNGGEGELIEPIKVNNGELIPTLEPSQLPKKANSIFVGWFVDGEVVDFATYRPTKSITLVAGWEEKSIDYEIEVIDGEATLVKWLNANVRKATIPALFGPNEVTKIAANAFAGMNNLEAVVLPESINEIGDNAFAELDKLAEITMGANVKKFGHNAFKGTAWLAAKQAENPLVVVNDILVDATTASGEVVVPATVLEIEAYAFENNEAITKVTVSEGVKKIRDHAFVGAINLTDAVLPHSLREVEANAFSIGGSGTLTIDATQVYYTKPVGYDPAWADGNGANVIVNWEITQLYEVILPDFVKPVDPEIIPATIKAGTVVEFVVTIPQYKQIKVVNANTESIAFVADRFSLTVDENLTVTVEFEYLPELVALVEQELAKVGPVVGIQQDSSGYFTSIRRELGIILNHAETTFTVENLVDNTFNLTVYYANDPELFVSKEVEIIGLFDINSLLIYKDASGSANWWNEAPKHMIDSDRTRTKWCDNGGSLEKYVSFEFAEEQTIGKVTINHAGVNESLDMNTKEFKISISDDNVVWEDVVVVNDNKDTTTVHLFTPVKTKYIKFSSTKGEQSGHTTRIYDFRVYGKAETVDITFDHNSGELNGEATTLFKVVNGQKMSIYDLPEPTKEFYRVDYWVDQNDEKVDFHTKVFTAPETIKAIWTPQIQYVNAIKIELNKVKDPLVVVAATQDAPTLEEIKAHVEKNVNLEIVSVTVEHNADNQYKIILNHAQATTISQEKLVTVMTKTEGETVNATFKLEGGLVNESGDDIVVAVDKGEFIPSDTIPAPTRQYYVFEGWFINGEAANLGSLIFLEDVIITAQWSVELSVMNEVITELNKLPMIIPVQTVGDEPTIDEVIAGIQALVDDELVTVTAQLQEGTEHYYSVKLISNKTADAYAEASKAVGKAVNMITTNDVKILNTTDPKIAAKGVETVIYANFDTDLTINKVLIDAQETTAVEGHNITYVPTADFTLEIIFDVVLEEAERLMNEALTKVPNKIALFDYETYTQESLQNHIWTNFLDGTYEQELTYFGLDNYTVSLRHKINNAVKVSKIVEVGMAKDITNLFRAPTSNWDKGYDYSNCDDDQSYSTANMLDNNPDGTPNLNTSWRDTKGKDNYSNYMPNGSRYSNLYTSDVSPVIVVISHAGAMPGGDAVNNTVDYEIWLTNSSWDYTMRSLEKVAEVKDNTENVNTVYLPGQTIKTLHIRVLKGGQNRETAEIADVRIYEMADMQTITFDLAGGNINGSTEDIKKRYGVDIGMKFGETLPQPTLLNHTLKHFVNVDNPDDIITADTEVTKGGVYKAVYERTVTPTITHAITFDLVGGNVEGAVDPIVINAYDQETYQYGLAADVPVPVKEYYDFIGFFDDLNQEFNLNDTVTEAKTYYAKWELKPEVANSVNEELAKISDPFVIDTADEPITTSTVQTAVEALVDTTKVAILVTENGVNNFTIKLTHVAVETVTAEKTVTTDWEINPAKLREVSAELDKVLDNFIIDTNEDPILATTVQAEVEKLVDLAVVKVSVLADENITNKFKVTLTHFEDENVSKAKDVTVDWKLNPKYLRAVEAEMAKITNPLIIDTEDDPITLATVQTAVNGLVDSSVVVAEVTENATEGYDIKLTHVTETSVFLEKTVVADWKINPQRLKQVQEELDKIPAALVIDTEEDPILAATVESEINKLVDTSVVRVVATKDLNVEKQFQIKLTHIDDSAITLEKDVTVDWKIQPAIMQELRAEMAKIPTLLPVDAAGAEPTVEEIKGLVETLVDSNNVTVLVTKGVNTQEYNIELTSTKDSAALLTEQRAAGKKAVMTADTNVEILNTTDKNHAVIGVANIIKITHTSNQIIDKVTITVGVDATDFTDVIDGELSYVPTADFSVEVTYTVDPAVEKEALDAVMSKIGDKVIMFDYLGHTVETVKTHLIDNFIGNDYNVELEETATLGNFKVTVTHPTISGVQAEKEFELAMPRDVTSKFKVVKVDDYGQGFDFSEADAGHDTPNVFDTYADGTPNLTTSWKDTNGSNEPSGILPEGSRFINLYSNDYTNAQVIKISHAGAMPTGDVADNTVDFDILTSSDGEYGFDLKTAVTFAQIRANTQSVTTIYGQVPALKTIHLNILKGGQTRETAEIADIRIYEAAIMGTITFDLDGGNVDGNTTNIAKRYGININMKFGDTIPTPTLAGKTFKHFVNEEDGTIITADTIITKGNVTYKAIYE